MPKLEWKKSKGTATTEQVRYGPFLFTVHCVDRNPRNNLWELNAYVKLSDIGTDAFVRRQQIKGKRHAKQEADKWLAGWLTLLPTEE